MKSKAVTGKLELQKAAINQGLETLARKDTAIATLLKFNYVAYLVYEETEAGGGYVEYADLRAAWEDEYRVQTGRTPANINPFHDDLGDALGAGHIARMLFTDPQDARYYLPPRIAATLGMAVSVTPPPPSLMTEIERVRPYLRLVSQSA